MYYVHTIVNTKLLYSSIEFPKLDLKTNSDYLTYTVMAIRVVEFSNGVYKIRKIFA